MNIGGVLRPNWGALKDQVRYGAQGQIANLAQLFNYRLDQFLVVGDGSFSSLSLGSDPAAAKVE